MRTGVSSQTFTYAYDATSGFLTQQTNPNMTQTLFTLDNPGAEVRRIHQKNVAGMITNLATYTQLYEPSRLLKQVQRTNSATASANYSRALTYDVLGQMTQEDLTDNPGNRTSQRYAYLPNGDRQTHETYSTPVGGVQSDQGGERFNYDAGNQLQSVSFYSTFGGTPIGTDSFTSGFDGMGNQRSFFGR